MKLLHTADWHLGRLLYGKKRHNEFNAFLAWLEQVIINEKIDTLIIAGDVFDTTMPSNFAQKLYYKFLYNISLSPCKNVIIIGGNHDSPTFLNAPQELLRILNVHVIGAISECIEDEIIIISNDTIPQAIICAVPYLRDRDIRTVESGETIDQKNKKLVEGIKNHYAQVCTLAEQKRNEFYAQGYKNIPLIATGHLFMQGGKTLEDDGVRELYIGSLLSIYKHYFPSSIDYFALGHLHVPQIVGGDECMRYSGSPIPMGFGEARQQKSVVIVEFINTVSVKNPTITVKEIPCFQKLVHITGSLDDITNAILNLKQEESSAWLEIEYTGQELIENLQEVAEELIENSALEIRRIKNKPVIDRVLLQSLNGETLQDLTEDEVFLRCLDSANVSHENREALIAAHNEIVHEILHKDKNA